MKFKYYLNDKLPKLAWSAVILEDIDCIYVYHGTDVEVYKDFFVEGAWSGNFKDSDFYESSLFLGSGCKISKDNLNVIFSTPSHTLERLYTIHNDNILFISNSLPFILYISDNNLDLNYIDYERDFNSILKGLKEYKRFIILEENKKIELHYNCNLYIDNSLEIIQQRKKQSGKFNNYEDYEKRLIKDTKTLIENAQSKERKKTYGLVTTISKGYDASACAAIAKELGCNTAVTFDSPKKYEEDSGEDIAIDLGYDNIIKKDAHSYLKDTSKLEAEFVSSGELGTGIVFTGFEKEFENNIAFTGERGDKIWDKNRYDENNDFRFEDEVFSGTSLIENRLKVGYIIMPMPLYGADEWPSIHKISNSNNMNTYSVGGDYDRPIPRRILETRGVDRESFGMEKKGAGFNYRFDNLKRLKKRMSKESYDSFFKFYKNNKRTGFKNLKSWVDYLWNTKSIYFDYVLRKIGISYKYKSLSSNAYSNPGAPSYLIIWANEIMIEKYQKSKIDKWWLYEERE